MGQAELKYEQEHHLDRLQSLTLSVSSQLTALSFLLYYHLSYVSLQVLKQESVHLVGKLLLLADFEVLKVKPNALEGDCSEMDHSLVFKLTETKQNAKIVMEALGQLGVSTEGR